MSVTLQKDKTVKPPEERDEYPTQSTYRVPVTVTDRETGDPVDLTAADITVVITESRAGDTELFRATEADSEIDTSDAIDGEVTLEIPATDVEWLGVVWEEWRITFPSTNKSAVVTQRSILFTDTATDA